MEYCPWWRGNEALVNVEGGSNVEVEFAVQKNHVDAVAIARTHASRDNTPLIDFSLYSLPIRTQAVYGVLLMIPIGALIMVLMRNFIGIDAFGTFMPVLIALAFRETKLFWGVVLFTLLVTLGLSIRFLLERLRLLLVPRLSAVLIVVVMLMLVISLTSHKLGTETGLSVALTENRRAGTGSPSCSRYNAAREASWKPMSVTGIRRSDMGMYSPSMKPMPWAP